MIKYERDAKQAISGDFNYTIEVFSRQAISKRNKIKNDYMKPKIPDNISETDSGFQEILSQKGDAPSQRRKKNFGMIKKCKAEPKMQCKEIHLKKKKIRTLGCV